jgi:hypothetical protein
MKTFIVVNWVSFLKTYFVEKFIFPITNVK